MIDLETIGASWNADLNRGPLLRHFLWSMRCTTRLVPVLLFLGLATPVAAGSYNDAATAYLRGDFQTALHILRPLAEHGDVNAQFNLGVMYKKGDGVPQDTIEAAKWYEKAADQGYAPAEYNLASLYEKGLGVPPDYTKAAALYRAAAEQGLAEAENNLCGMYWNGRGVSQNDAEAAKWCLRSADHGYTIAQYNLGLMYESGDGVKQDYTAAYTWFDLAASNADAQALTRRDFVATMMTPTQIAEARKHALDWRLNSKLIKSARSYSPALTNPFSQGFSGLSVLH